MINEAQRNTIKELLVLQGLTFKPLQEEMLDHMCCDVEEKMANGASFEEALQTTLSDIPNDHFITIQKHTMDTINKRFTLSKWLSYSAIGFLLCSLIFKILHLQFTDALLLLSFVLIAVSLLTNSVSGIYMNREKRGAINVLAVIIGVVTLLIGYTFKILHLPGADQIIILAVTTLIVSLFVNTWFVYKNASGEGNLLSYLHEKYTPGIERFLLYLLLPVTLYKIVIMLSGEYNFVGGLILLIVIFGAGLQFIALTWRGMESNIVHRTRYKLTGTIISFMCLVLVFLGTVLPLELRIVMILLYSSVTAWLAFKLEQPETISLLLLTCFVPLLFFGWAMVKLELAPPELNGFIFNLPVLLVLIVGLFLCRKNDTMRTYMIVSLSSYVFEYVING